jgi:tRNA(Ile)-lysidine synthase
MLNPNPDLIAAAALDRRLRSGLAAPVAVAVSGGGDSIAALLAAKAWADRNKRRLIVLAVDHGLQSASADWTAFVADAATRLGAGFRALAWEGDKPTRGLPAAARAARHRLLADAAREAGARVIVTGHTADDILEGALMRAWGSTLGALREWSPSPAWPEGRGVFLLRPLLGLRRAALRAWLVERGERWIDDPANVDPAQMRARARLALSGSGDPPQPAPPGCAAIAVCDGGEGFVRLDRHALQAAPIEVARRLVAMAALSAGGGARPPRGARLLALTDRLAAPGEVRATLCGARIAADEDAVMFARDAGEVARGGLAPLALSPGEPAVWDGRFELTAAGPGLQVRALGGLAARLERSERTALAAVAPLARPGLPAVVDAEGRVSCPILAAGRVQARDLVWDRLQAARGAISKEPAT